MKNSADHAADSVVQSDHPCAKCGYSLRTLRTDGVCPECGYAVAESLLSAEERLILLAEERLLAAKPAYERWNRRLPVIAGLALLAFILTPLLIAYFAPDVRSDAGFKFVVLLFAVIIFTSLFSSIAAIVAWYGCGVRLDHAALIEHARRAHGQPRDDRLQRRDDRIARREETYRRNIGALKALMVLAIFGVTCMAATTLSFFDSRALAVKEPFIVQIASAINWLVILWVLLWINQGRLAHAQSVRMRRQRRRAGAAR